MAEQLAFQNPRSKILIVEDSPVQAEMLKRLLVGQKYDVAIARNGAEGLAMAKKEKPNLVISDIMMPVMDGYTMGKKMKENNEMAKTPVLLLTQLTEPEEVINGLESGAYSYLTKPYNAEFLVSKVRYILENPDRYRNRPDRKSVEFEYDGKHYEVHAGRSQTLNYLITTYENAILKNKELLQAKEEFQLLNDRLEEKVKERTAALSIEIQERKQAEKELKERIDELERFHRVTVDREIRMHEVMRENEQLKKRIEELERKI